MLPSTKELDAQSARVAAGIGELMAQEWFSIAVEEELQECAEFDLELLLFWVLADVVDHLEHVHRLSVLTHAPESDWQEYLLEVRYLWPFDYGALGVHRDALGRLAILLDAYVRAAIAQGVELPRAAPTRRSALSRYAVDIKANTLAEAMTARFGFKRRSRAMVALSRVTEACVGVCTGFAELHDAVAIEEIGERSSAILGGCLVLEYQLHRLACAVLVHQTTWESIMLDLESRQEPSASGRASGWD